MDKIMYRTEGFSGSGVRDILEVMYFEIFYLNNIDILDYVSDHYLDPQGNLYKTCQELINTSYALETCFDGDAAYEFLDDIKIAINDKTKHNLKYALWLAPKEVVEDYYTDSLLMGNALEDSIEAYETSDVILSDLGGEGILFAYDNPPKKFNI